MAKRGLPKEVLQRRAVERLAREARGRAKKLEHAVPVHEDADDPHPLYQLRAEKGQPDGYAELGPGGLVPMDQLATGTPTGTKFVRDDGTLAVPGTGPGGDVVGPASSVDDEIPLFSGTTGKVLKNSSRTLSLTGGINKVPKTDAANAVLDTSWLPNAGIETLGQVEYCQDGDDTLQLRVPTTQDTRILKRGTSLPTVAPAGRLFYHTNRRFLAINDKGTTPVHDWRVLVAGGINSVDLIDEFASGRSVTGTIGSLGWLSTSGAIASLTSLVGHPGIFRLGSASGVAHIRLNPIMPNDVIYVACIVRAATGNTTMSARFGLIDDVGASGDASIGIYTAITTSLSGNLYAVTRGGAGVTKTSSGVAYTVGNWYLFEMVKNSSGNWEFYLNGSTTAWATHSTNIPNGTALNPAFVVETNEAVTKEIDVDLFVLRMADLGQRWT